MKILKALIYFVSIFLIPLFGYSQTSSIIVKVSTNGAKLTETQKTDSKVLKTLTAGENVELLEILFPNGEGSSPRYRVKYQETEGFITSYFIQPNEKIDEELRALKERQKIENAKRQENQKLIQDSLLKVEELRKNIDYEAEIIRNDSIADAMLKEAKAQNRLQNQQYLSQRRTKFHAKYGKELGEKIATKKIWIGMTEEMLIDSWGRPEDINTTATRYSTRKQFVYGGGQYVYVQNGVVDAWQN